MSKLGLAYPSSLSSCCCIFSYFKVALTEVHRYLTVNQSGLSLENHTNLSAMYKREQTDLHLQGCLHVQYIYHLLPTNSLILLSSCVLHCDIVFCLSS